MPPRSEIRALWIGHTEYARRACDSNLILMDVRVGGRPDLIAPDIYSSRDHLFSCRTRKARGRGGEGVGGGLRLFSPLILLRDLVRS